MVSLRKQLVNLLLGLVVGPFAEVPVADEAVSVDQVPRRPEALPGSVPDSVVVVQNYRIPDVLLPDGLLHVGDVFLEPELRGVDPNHEQAVVIVFLVQRVDVRLRVLAVETAVCPELDQHYLLTDGVLYRYAVRVDKASRACDLPGPRILVLLVRDPLRIRDCLLLARVTFRGAGTLGIAEGG